MTYTPDSRIKMYLVLTGTKVQNRLNLRRELYAGLTDKVLQALPRKSSKSQPEKNVRRTHG